MRTCKSPKTVSYSEPFVQTLIMITILRNPKIISLFTWRAGILVSRLSDGAPQHFFTGLLSVGDEIKSINKTSVQNMDVEQVYELMGQATERLEMVVLPYSARKDT